MKVGQYHTLRLDRITPQGAYLTDEETDVLLPTKYIPKDAIVDDELCVFVYRDSEDRIISTTLTPHLTTNQFGYLRVKDVSSVGAFLDWGIEKDLLVPFREQVGRLDVGQWLLVYLYVDEKTDRVVATNKIARFYETMEIGLEEGEEVELLITNTTDLGVNVVVNNTYEGLIYANDIFHDLLEGDRTKGYIKKVRADRKIDVSLRQTNLKNLEQGATQILDALKKKEGYLPLHDKSTPEDIQLELQMSKKNFKRSVGILYKKRLITLEKGGIRII